jgi:oligopeptide/dipeptide ABC transporter ATP-binding protein
MSRGQAAVAALDPAEAAGPPALEIDGLGLTLRRGETEVPVLRGVSLRLVRGETLALVGESGSGKSMTCLSVLGMLPVASQPRTTGAVRVHGRDVLGMTEPERRGLRGRTVSIVMQDSTAAFNPALTIGTHLDETLRAHTTLGRAERHRRAVELLESVGIPDGERRMRLYPHEFSGGMRQRVAGAIAVSCRPDLVIADEPTTALDPTIQVQYLALLKRLQAEYGFALLFVSHDLGAVAQVADRVAVMYAGEIVEEGRLADVLGAPRHPYTAGLLACAVGDPADADGVAEHRRLRVIGGEPPDLASLPSGCAFEPRCAIALPACRTERTVLQAAPGGNDSACLRRDDLAALRAVAT